MAKTSGSLASRIDRAQAVGAALWLAFGGAVLFFGWHLAMFNRRGGPGPGFFLKSLAVLLLVLALARAVSVLREAHAAAKVPEQLSFRLRDVLNFVLMVVALTLYAWLMPTLGFIVATAALCWATLVLAGRRPLRSLIEASLAAAFVYFSFTRGLGVPLPTAQLDLLRAIGL